VETLDKCFENVCELDLIFHVDKVQLVGLVLTIFNNGAYITFKSIFHKALKSVTGTNQF